MMHGLVRMPTEAKQIVTECVADTADF